MITSLNTHSAPMPRVITAASHNSDLETQKQNLQKRSSGLRELVKNSPDIVEISDQARALLDTAVFNKTTVPTADKADAAASGLPVGTREERIQSAKDYNKILEDLRSEYGEEEAMRRFDAIMKEDGYELVTVDNNRGISASGGMLPSMRNNLTMGVLMPPNGQGMSTTNLQTHSSIRGALGANGEVEYLAETYANYASNLNQDVRDALGGVYEKNLAAAQKGVSFDLRGYMSANFGANPSTSAVSVSTDLGAVARDLFQKAGVEVGADEQVRFSLNEDGGLYVSGAFDEAERAAIDAVLAKNPSIAQAFKDEHDSVALTDTSDLAGAFKDGARSVEYREAQRSFVYSGAEPSAVVMTDFIAVRSTGYNYQKKVSDSFDINADNRSAVGSGVNLVTLDFEASAKVNQALQDKLNEAVASGGAIESTVSQAEFDSIKKAQGGGFAGSGPNADGLALGIPLGPDGEFVSQMHYAEGSSGSIEEDLRAEEAKRALMDLASDPENDRVEIAYVDKRREARVATAAQLLKMFEVGRNLPGAGMIASIMESLARMNAGA